MTKAELIRKVAKRAGIPDQEAKFFFELFLKKASLQLHPGETIKMKDLGYFQLKTGRIKKAGSSGEGEIYSEFMVFYSMNPETKEENLIFNVPVLEEEKYNFIDSFFSLSFGKPVIPLKNSSSSEFFVPPAGAELRRLAEIKSEKLLQEVEIVDKDFKGSENLIFEQDATDVSKVEMDWNKPEDTKRDTENTLSWDFNSDLDKEIEKESILDTGSEDNAEVNWDFGEHLSKESNEEKDRPDEYKQVQSLHSEYHMPKVESWDSGEEEILKESISEEFIDNKFSVSHETPEDNTPVVDLPEEPEEPVKQEDTFINDNEIVTPAYLDEVMSYPDEPVYEDKAPAVRKRKGIGLFLILSIFILLSAALLFYFKILNPTLNPVKVVYIPAKTIPSNAVIERNYEVPVTYPYDNETKLNDFQEPYNIVPPQIHKDSTVTVRNEGIKNSGTEKEQNKAATDITGNQQKQAVSDSPVKVKEFIYKRGDKYMVQVSSWQGKSYAEKHAAKFQAMGMQTEIEKVFLYGDPWYRVRVGYFNSISDAEKYFQNNR